MYIKRIFYSLKRHTLSPKTVSIPSHPYFHLPLWYPLFWGINVHGFWLSIPHHWDCHLVQVPLRSVDQLSSYSSSRFWQFPSAQSSLSGPCDQSVYVGNKIKSLSQVSVLKGYRIVIWSHNSRLQGICWNLGLRSLLFNLTRFFCVGLSFALNKLNKYLNIQQSLR